MKIAGTSIRSVEGRVLLWMLVLDVAFLCASLAYHYSDIFVDRRYSINGHGGYGEMYQYAKEFTCALLLASAALRCRQALPATWALLFFYVVLTDALRINQTIAALIASNSALGFLVGGFSTWQLKLAVVAAFGSLLALVIIRAHRASDSSVLKEDSWGLCILLLLYLSFGIVVDTFNRFFKPTNVDLAQLFLVVEEWGEMLFMSLLVIGAYLSFVRCLRAHLPRHAVSIETATRRQPLTRM